MYLHTNDAYSGESKHVKQAISTGPTDDVVALIILDSYSEFSGTTLERSM